MKIRNLRIGHSISQCCRRTPAYIAHRLELAK